MTLPIKDYIYRYTREKQQAPQLPEILRGKFDFARMYKDRNPKAITTMQKRWGLLV
jgi:hypothetical protein